MIEPFDTIGAVLKIVRDFFVRYFLPLHGEVESEEAAEPPALDIVPTECVARGDTTAADVPPPAGDVEQFSHSSDP